MTLAEFANSFKSGWGAASAAVTAGPFALFAAGLTPPWPSEDGSAAAGLATLFGLMGLTLAYVNGRNRANRRRSVLSLGGAGVLVVAFVIGWSLLFVAIPQRVDGTVVDRRYVAGVTMRDRPKQLKLDREAAIKRLKLRGTYSNSSLLAGRMALLLPWLLAFGLLTYGFGLQQLRRR